MDTWNILNKELAYYGFYLIDDTKCKFIDIDGKQNSQGIIRTMRMLKKIIIKHKEILASLWDNACDDLSKHQERQKFYDEKLKKIFIFTLKDMMKFLLMFDDLQNLSITQDIENALHRDIYSFSSEQMNKIIDYKISIDWVHRTIHRLNYICSLLAFASLGKKKVSQYNIKMAKGISGPWANLDLPTLERAYPFESESLKGRTKDKQKQRRYWKGLQNYNNDGRVGEGHYWREIRNEPYSWYDSNSESPYPHRNLLWN